MSIKWEVVIGSEVLLALELIILMFWPQKSGELDQKESLGT